MKLETPQEKHKKAYEKIIEEWQKVESIQDTSPFSFSKNFDFENFLKEIKKYLNKDEVNVCTNTFFLIEKSDIIWIIDIRHHINHPILIESGWHIWYWIAPKFRRKWYATKILELWLIEAKKFWLEKVLITCSIDNIWSKKVILKNWWVFERLTKDWKMNRFWVEL